MKKNFKIIYIILYIFFILLNTNSEEAKIIITGGSYGNYNYIAKKYLLINEETQNLNNFLLYDTGNFMGNYGKSAIDSGKLPISIMNIMEYTGVCIGNHEFDYGYNELINRIEESNFSYLSSNIEVENLDTVRYQIKNINNIKIGVLSLGEYRSKVLIGKELIEKNIFETTEQTIREFKHSNCDVIIVLADMNFDQAGNILTKFTEIDYIFLGAWKYDNRDSNLDRNITLDGRGIINCFRDDVLVLNINKASNNDISFNINRKTYNENINYKTNNKYNKITNLIIDYETRKVIPLKENKLNNFDIKISLHQIALNYLRDKTYSEVAFLNTGAFDNNDILSGNVTAWDIFTKLRYNNTIYKIIMTGRDIKNVLKIDDEKKEKGSSKNLYYSGITWNKRNKYEINGRPINDNEKYLVALNDFLYAGKDNFISFKNGIKLKKYDEKLREELYDYITNLVLKNGKLTLKPALYWKYKIDLGASYTGNFNYNNQFYPDNSKLPNDSMYHLLNSHFIFYNEWKNRWNLIALNQEVNYEFLFSEIEDINEEQINFEVKNISLVLHSDFKYEFNFQFVSPYALFALDNLRFKLNDELDESYKHMKLIPEIGIRHYFYFDKVPIEINVAESFLLNIYPLKEPSETDPEFNKVEFLFKINGFMKIYFKDFIIFTPQMNFYIFILPEFNFAYEIIGNLKFKIFKFLYFNIDGTFYVDIDEKKPAINLTMNAGISVLLGRVKL